MDKAKRLQGLILCGLNRTMLSDYFMAPFTNKAFGKRITMMAIFEQLFDNPDEF